MPTLATRGRENALKMALMDTTCMRSGTINVNVEHMRNVKSAVFSALTASTERDKTTEVREEKEQQRGEVRKECNLSEAFR